MVNPRPSLRQLNIRLPEGAEKELEFNHGAAGVADLLRRCLGDVELDRHVKLVIVLRDPAAGHNPQEHDRGEVLIVEWPVDLQGYWLLTSLERKDKIVELIVQALEFVFQRHGWNDKPLKRAASEARALGLKNVQSWPAKPVKSPDGLRLAQVSYDFEVDGIYGSIEIADASGGLRLRKQVFKLEPVDYFLSEALGKLRWVDTNTVVLESSSRERSWTVSLATQLH